MTDSEADDLLEKYKEGKATEEEVNYLLFWVQSFDASPPKKFSEEELGTVRSEMWAYLTANHIPVQSVKLWPRIALAAAAIVAVVFGIWIYTSRLEHRENLMATDIVPGKNTATITLANGKTITLNGAKTGITIAGEKLTYNDGSTVADRGGDETSLAQAQTLIASTPNGSTYQITLPDGSKVWLNAASKITFPSTFSGLVKNRVVELVGEAYFEVYRDKKHPFIVRSRGQQIEVLGTHFNVSTYPDEPIVKTTLLEGSVLVNGTILKPNEQAVLSGNTITVKPVNMDDEMAWKNGEFALGGENLKGIMRKIARWYNVEIVYDAGINENAKLDGWISRSSKLAEVLQKIEIAGDIRFKVEGRRVLVTK